MPPDIDGHSLTTVPVIQMFNDTILGSATSFIWRRGTHFLITNWHVVTARDFNSGANLRCDAGRPNKFRAYFAPRGPSFEKFDREIPLYDEHDKPRWLVHGVHGHRVDVVAIPLSEADDKIWYHPINDMNVLGLDIRIGMDVYILGYPFGAEPPYLPIWKRGSIASEPQLARIGHKYFFIDTASRPGMSGGPVIRRSWGTHITEGGHPVFSRGSATNFLGVYSGRTATKDPLDAQLGFVWPLSFIEEIIDCGKRDET